MPIEVTDITPSTDTVRISGLRNGFANMTVTMREDEAVKLQRELTACLRRRGYVPPAEQVAEAAVALVTEYDKHPHIYSTPGPLTSRVYETARQYRSRAN